MITICAWCSAERELKGLNPVIVDFDKNHDDGLISHGICKECIDKTIVQEGEKKHGRASTRVVS